MTARTISQRALFERCRRLLAHNGETLRKARGRWLHDLGPYYVVDVRYNCISQKGIELEKLAQDLGVLPDGEAVDS